MQIKNKFLHTAKSGQTNLGDSSKTLYPIDVVRTVSELIPLMIHAKIFSITDINQPVVIAPSIRIGDTVESDFTLYDCLHRGYREINNDFPINRSIKVEYTEDDGFSRNTVSSFIFNPPNAKETFIDFYFSRKSEQRFTKFKDAFPNRTKITICQIAVKTNEPSYLGGV